jgi:hypothetical protein
MIHHVKSCACSGRGAASECALGINDIAFHTGVEKTAAGILEGANYASIT